MKGVADVVLDEDVRQEDHQKDSPAVKLTARRDHPQPSWRLEGRKSRSAWLCETLKEAIFPGGNLLTLSRNVSTTHLPSYASSKAVPDDERGGQPFCTVVSRGRGAY